MSSLATPLVGRAALELAFGGDSVVGGEIAVDSAIITTQVNAPGQWVLSLVATSRAAYEKSIVSVLLSEDREVRVRWGVIGTSAIWTPWETCRIVTCQPQLHSNTTPQGFPFDLVLADRLYDLTLESRVAARTGSVSALVEEIASSYDIEVLTEPTISTPATLIQSYQTDFDFLRERLLPAAVNKSGFASYYFYVDADRLHFHTREYQQPLAIIPYNQMPSASQLIVVDDAQSNARDGGVVRTVAYDPLTGLTQVITSEPEKYTRFERRLSQVRGSVLQASHVGPNQLAWITAQTQAQYAAARDRYQRIGFVAPNIPQLRAGASISLQLPDANDSASGIYFIEKTELVLRGGAASTAVTALRGEMAGGRVTTGTSGDGLPPAFDAPGKDVVFSTSTPNTPAEIPVQSAQD